MEALKKVIVSKNQENKQNEEATQTNLKAVKLLSTVL